jgi:hypothetical protein
VKHSADQWKGLIKRAVVMTAVGAVLTIAGSLKDYNGITRVGELLAFGGFLLFLFARIKFSRCQAQEPD